MNTSLFKYLMLSMFSLVFFCTCDKDDELSGEEFRVTMENRFFSIKTSKTFTKKDGSTEIMQEGKSYLADSPSTIWFHDSKLYIPIQISSKDTLWQKWNAYQREKELGNILLLVGHKYMYESQGNGLITPDQLLVHEQLGGRFYLKTDGDNLLHATILYPDDIADDDTIFPKSEFYYQEELSPDKNVSLEYHVYDSDEEAIAYIIEQMKDWKPSE